MENTTALRGELRAVDLRCGRGRRVLLDSVTATFSPGTVSALLGPNGAGKSTLIATLVGDLAPGSGTVLLDGDPVQGLPDRSRRFGVVTEAHGLPRGMRVGSAIAYWADVNGVSRAERDAVSRALGTDDFATSRVGKLSTGMRRRLELVLALMTDPRVAVLDEPFNGLDLSGVEMVREQIRRLRDAGRTVLLSTHTMNEVDELADHAFAVHQQSLVPLEFSPGTRGAAESAYKELHRDGARHD